MKLTWNKCFQWGGLGSTCPILRLVVCKSLWGTLAAFQATSTAYVCRIHAFGKWENECDFLLLVGRTANMETGCEFLRRGWWLRLCEPWGTPWPAGHRPRHAPTLPLLQDSLWCSLWEACGLGVHTQLVGSHYPSVGPIHPWTVAIRKLALSWERQEQMLETEW